jgi:hypothetical protein
MYQLTLAVQRTRFGWRIGGPDPDRAMYLAPDGRGSTLKINSGNEPLWASDELELFVNAVHDGVEITVKILSGRQKPAPSHAKAA